jgi:ligand-binding sensor domain-containing protein
LRFAINCSRTGKDYFFDVKFNHAIKQVNCSDNIIRIFKDNVGNMWIGTTKGLSRYSKEGKSFKNYDEKDGLANNFI